jgi:hypothetical protein
MLRKKNEEVKGGYIKASGAYNRSICQGTAGARKSEPNHTNGLELCPDIMQQN